MRTINLDAAGRSVALTVNPDDHIGRIITTYRDFYERALLDDAAARLTHAAAGCIIDVGAHIGNHALYLAAATGRDVYALEPYEPSRRVLAHNIQQNELPVEVFPLAAGAEPGLGSLVAPRDGNTGTAAVALADWGEVEVARLDTIVVEPVSMIKIDTEDTAGGIPVTDVLAGANLILRTHSPVLYVEGDRDEITRALPRGYEWFGTYGRTPTHGFHRRPV